MFTTEFINFCRIHGCIVTTASVQLIKTEFSYIQVKSIEEQYNLFEIRITCILVCLEN